MKIKAIIIFTCVFLCACNSMSTRRSVNDLNASIKTYDSALRWGDMIAAASYHVSREGIQQQVDIEQAEKFSVTGFDILEKTVDVEAGTAIIKIQISYYNEQYGTVHTLRQDQIWWLDRENKQWFIESPFPPFK